MHSKQDLALLAAQVPFHRRDNTYYLIMDALEAISAVFEMLPEDGATLSTDELLEQKRLILESLELAGIAFDALMTRDA